MRLAALALVGALTLSQEIDRLVEMFRYEASVVVDANASSQSGTKAR